MTAALGLSLASACGRPVQDDFKSEGGMAPDPTGIIEGSVLYIGPRPTCEYKGDSPERIVGRVVLTMFIFDNPPPPEGRATTAENLLVLAGDKMFKLSDCAPKDSPADLANPIMRSVPFRWPQIELKEAARDFQIRGFYDYDEDMNPFFSVTNLPTAGDIAGAAIVNLQNPAEGFLRISMPAFDSAHDGYIKTGVTVALANHVWTERPAFKISEANRQLDAEQHLPVAIDFAILAPDTPKTLQQTWELTCATKDTPGCGFSLESLDPADAPKLAAAGVNLDFSPQRYAFTVTPVDIKTVVDGGPDLAKPDGIPDPHPLLGATLPIPFTLPFVILQRRAETPEQAKIEAAAKIPSVTMLGAALPAEIETKKTFVGKMNIAVPPIAVVELDANNVACRVPYAPPGNSTATYEARVSVCHDLPTGVFGVNVLHGIAGGRPEQVDPSISDNGLAVVGGGSSGQAWTLPNQLADEGQVGEENVLAHQGEGALFVVHDPKPDKQEDCTEAPDPAAFNMPRAVKYKQVCAPGVDPMNQSEGLYGTPKGIDGNECLLQACCDNVKHLCGVPLCEVRQERGLNVRKSPTSLEPRTIAGQQVQVPNCVPFEIPDLCCAAGVQ